MLTDIRETERAVVYLCLAVDERFPAGPIDLTLYRNGHVPAVRNASSRSELRTLVERLCRHFPEATVFLDEDEKHPPCVAILCRCRASLRELCRKPCQHIGDRPTVVIVPKGSDVQATEDASRRGLSLLQRALVEQASDLKRRQLSSKRDGRGRHHGESGHLSRRV